MYAGRYVQHVMFVNNVVFKDITVVQPTPANYGVHFPKRAVIGVVVE